MSALRDRRILRDAAPGKQVRWRAGEQATYIHATTKRCCYLSAKKNGKNAEDNHSNPDDAAEHAARPALLALD